MIKYFPPLELPTAQFKSIVPNMTEAVKAFGEFDKALRLPQLLTSNITITSECRLPMNTAAISYPDVPELPISMAVLYMPPYNVFGVFHNCKCKIESYILELLEEGEAADNAPITLSVNDISKYSRVQAIAAKRNIPNIFYVRMWAAADVVYEIRVNYNNVVTIGNGGTSWRVALQGRIQPVPSDSRTVMYEQDNIDDYGAYAEDWYDVYEDDDFDDEMPPALDIGALPL